MFFIPDHFMQRNSEYNLISFYAHCLLFFQPLISQYHNPQHKLIWFLKLTEKFSFSVKLLKMCKNALVLSVF